VLCTACLRGKEKREKKRTEAISEQHPPNLAIPLLIREKGKKKGRGKRGEKRRRKGRRNR